MALLALIATACLAAPAASGPTAGSTSTAPRSREESTSSPLPSPSGSGAHKILGEEYDIAAPCIAGDITVEPGAFFWLACTFDTTPPTAQIIRYARPSGPSTVVYQPARVGTGISLLRVSPSWITWVEYADIFTAKDEKLYALPRTGGDPILLEDPAAHRPLAALMDTALDGAEAYWTLPVIENGQWHGRLMHQHLADGPTEVVAQAPFGSVLGWLSVSQGSIAYELSSETEIPQTRVMLRSSDGRTRDIGVLPSSEPTLGDGFVAFKSAERYSTGDVAVLRLADGVVLRLGPGEAPKARGPFVTWHPGGPHDHSLKLARPLRGCVDSLGDDPETIKAAATLGPNELAWLLADPAQAGQRRLHYASLNVWPDAPCSPASPKAGP